MHRSYRTPNLGLLAMIGIFMPTIFLTAISCSPAEEGSPVKGETKEVRGLITDKQWGEGDNKAVVWIAEGRASHGYPIDPPKKVAIWGNLKVGDSVTLQLTTPKGESPVVTDVNGVIAAQEQEDKDRGDQKN